MKTRALFKQKFNKWFVVGVIAVIIITSISILIMDMKNIYDYLFIFGFAYFIVKLLYFHLYRN